MISETVYQRFRKKRITTVTRLEYDNYAYTRSLKCIITIIPLIPT